ERGAFAEFAFGPHAATVTLDDALHGSQADTRPFELLVAVKALKDTEQLGRIGHIETHALVTDVVDGASIRIRATELDVGTRLVARELPGVSHQIVDDGSKERGVSLFGEPVVDHEFDSPRRIQFLQSLGRGSRELTQIDRAPGELGSRDSAQFE